MKRRLILTALTMLVLFTYGQNSNPWPTSGNVGIGTSAPGYSLDVVGKIGVSNGITMTGVPHSLSDVNYIHAANNTSTIGLLAGTGTFSALSGPYVGGRGNAFSVFPGQRGLLFLSGGEVQSPTGIEGGITFTTTSGAGIAESIRMIVSRNGQVGIGTTEPNYPLHLSQSSNDGTAIKLENTNATGTAKFVQFMQLGPNGHSIPGWANTALLEGGADGGLSLSAFAGDLKLYTGNARSLRMFIRKSDGNVGIGTDNPQAKLAVNGDIFSKKVRVTQTGWPDYVFEAGYRLRPIGELEQFIARHHHLPDVLAAAEVEKHGLDLGENQAVLLRKIEELTLYVIEQNRKMEKQQEEIDGLKKELKKRQ